MVFPAVKYGCESWTGKKAEHWRTDDFELWCWRLLRVPWTARRSNQSILKEISPGCSLEGLMLKLKLQYFGHLRWRADSLEKTLMLWKIEGRRRRGWQRMRWLDGPPKHPTQWTRVWVDSGIWWWTGKPGMLQSRGHRVRDDWTTVLNWQLPWWSEKVKSESVKYSVISDSSRPHGPKYARPPCPSPTPEVYPNSCQLSQWCHPTILSSVDPFSSSLQSFPASGSFPMSQLFTSGGQSIGVSVSTSVLPVNIQEWFPLGWTGWISLQSKGLSRVFSNTTVQKHPFFGAQLSS